MMMRGLWLVCVGFLAAPLWAGETALTSALTELRKGDWDKAQAEAKQGGQIVLDIIEWQRLRNGQGTFADYRAFLARNSDWPGLARLRARGEGKISASDDPAQVVAYFGERTPSTGAGVVALVRAQEALGQDGEAEVTAVLAWRSQTLSTDAENWLMRRYAEVLKPHHKARLDDLLWRNRATAARRMYPRISDDLKALAEARIALRTRAAGVDGLIAKVPAALQDDPGLAYERFNWRARKGRQEDAITLMLERSVSPESLGQPEAWAQRRRAYAREAMREGNIDRAYALASLHFLYEGSNYSDLEWLSGYIALRYLEDPELALLHFDNFRAAVETPISLGRAGYWQGRAYEALGDPESAKAAYAFGAKYQSSFYGLLAAEALGQPLDPQMAGTETFPKLEETRLAGSSVVKAAELLLAVGENALAEWFLTHLTETATREEAGALGAWMLAEGEDHIALKIAKQAARNGHILAASYFPLHPMAKEKWPVAPELALAIARRESEFDPVVESPAGALGLMQLMPGTAKEVAGELEIDYSKSRLTTDPAYNATLGTAYLEDLIEIFGQSPVLVSVGYNAGPSRGVRWSEQRGDPRSAGIDLVDWIEHIPFRETRNYVMRVTESLPVYRARLSGQAGPLDFTGLLAGRDRLN